MTPWETRRFLWGYADAGKQLVAAKDSRPSLIAPMNSLRGKQISPDRELQPLGDGSEDPDWDAFDSRTYERSLGRRGTERPGYFQPTQINQRFRWLIQ